MTGKDGATLTEAQKSAAMDAARSTDAAKRNENLARMNSELDARVKRLAAAANAEAMNSRQVEIANDLADAERAGLVKGSAAWDEYAAKVTKAVDAKHDRTLKEQMADSALRIDDEVKKLQAETDAIGMGALARMQLVEALKLEDDTRKKLAANPGQRAEIEAAEAINKAKMSAAIADNYNASRSFEAGSKTAFQKYQEDAGNAAAYAERMIGGGFQHMEDALINFAHTGKLSFSSLFSFMADEYLRNVLRMQMANATSSGGWMGGLASSLVGLFTGSTELSTSDYGSSGFATGSNSNYGNEGGVHLATGTNYVPYDGMPAILHKGEAVVPAAYNPAVGGAGGGHTFDFSGQTISVGAGVSRGEVQAAVAQGNAAVEARIKRVAKQGLLQ